MGQSSPEAECYASVHGVGGQADVQGAAPKPIEARTLTKAAIFAGGPLPVLVRFSNFTGTPTIPD